MSSLSQAHEAASALRARVSHHVMRHDDVVELAVTQAHQALQYVKSLLTQNTQEMTGYTYDEMTRWLRDKRLPQRRIQLTGIREPHRALERHQVIELSLDDKEHRHTAWALYQRGPAQGDLQIPDHALSA